MTEKVLIVRPDGTSGWLPLDDLRALIAALKRIKEATG